MVLEAPKMNLEQRGVFQINSETRN